MGGAKGVICGAGVVWAAAVTVFLLGSAMALERTLTPDAFFVGPLKHNPFDSITLDYPSEEILMLSSAVKDAEGVARIYFHRLDLSKEAQTAEPALLSSPDFNAENGQLRLGSNDRLHALWLEVIPRRSNQLVHGFSDDGGKTWSKRTTFPAGFSRKVPVLGVFSDGLILVAIESSLQRRSSQRLSMWASADGGESWRETNPNTLRAAGDANGLRIVSDGPDKVMAAWIQHTDRGNHVMVNVSSDGGGSWLEEPIRVSDDPERRILSVDPFVAADGFAVAWMDGGPFNYRFVFDRSDAGGRSWGQDAVLCELKVQSATPQVLLSKDRLFLVTKEVEGDGRASFEKLVLRAYRYPDLTEIRSPLVVDDAGKFGRTIVDFFASFSQDNLYLSSIAHSHSGGWINRLWSLDGELLWQDTAGTQREVTSTVLSAVRQQLWMVTRERMPRRFPQQTRFEGRLVLRKFEL